MDKRLIFISSIILVISSWNNNLVSCQDNEMNMNDRIKDMGYMEIKDRSKTSAGSDSLTIKIPPKSSGKKPEFKYKVQATRGKPAVEITIEPDAPIAVGQSLDWSKAHDINKNKLRGKPMRKGK